MATYFAFNDDNGKYFENASIKQLRAHPFLIRSTLLLRSDEYQKLCNKVNYRKRKYELPENREIKWSYPWSLRKHSKNNEEIKSDRPYYFLKDIDYHKVVDFIDDALSTLSELNYLKIILTITKGTGQTGIKQISIQKMHLETSMQRIEMELNSDSDGLCILFLDPESKEVDQSMREAYYKIRANGSFLSKYKKIKDSLSFEDSNHSIGIQMADYVAGATGAFLRSQSSENFQKGKEMFENHVRPFIRQKDGSCLGFGICEIPTLAGLRSELKNIFEPNLRHPA